MNLRFAIADLRLGRQEKTLPIADFQLPICDFNSSIGIRKLAME